MISVIILTKDEKVHIARTLASVSGFDDFWVVDSHSNDSTLDIAHQYGANTMNFTWNGQYPRKKQWALDYVPTKYDWVLLLDADEIVTPALARELKSLNHDYAGYFIKGQPVWDGKILRFGTWNNKLQLLNKTRMHFPVLDDLHTNLWEVEGHYQPVLRDDVQGKIGQMRAPIIHHNLKPMGDWHAKHEIYADWQAGVDLPGDARLSKKFFHSMPKLRPVMAFLHSFILKGGFLDGRAGYRYAKSRAQYYKMVNAAR